MALLSLILFYGGMHFIRGCGQKQRRVSEEFLTAHSFYKNRIFLKRACYLNVDITAIHIRSVGGCYISVHVAWE